MSWVSMGAAFDRTSLAELVQVAFARLMVNQAEIVRADPKQTMRLKMAANMPEESTRPITFRLIFDDEESPWLDSVALSVWVCTRWPHVFQMGG